MMKTPKATIEAVELGLSQMHEALQAPNTCSPITKLHRQLWVDNPFVAVHEKQRKSPDVSRSAHALIGPECRLSEHTENSMLIFQSIVFLVFL